MTYEEAEKIFIEWKDYMEINEKLISIFLTLPESFLPYSKNILEEALNIIAEDEFNNGSKDLSNNIIGTMGSLIKYEKDDEAIIKMSNFLEKLTKDPAMENLKNIRLEKLNKARENWKRIKNK